MYLPIHPRSGLYDALCYEGHLRKWEALALLKITLFRSVLLVWRVASLWIIFSTAMLSPFIVSRISIMIFGCFPLVKDSVQHEPTLPEYKDGTFVEEYVSLIM